MFAVALALTLSPTASAVTLDEALAAAEQNSIDLGLVRARTDATRALPGQAWSLLSPKLVVNGSYTWNEEEVAFAIPEEFEAFFPDSEPIVFQPKRNGQASFSVQQSLFSAEALPLLIGAYRTVDAAEHDEVRLRSQIRLGVVTAYYGVLTAREAEVLAEEARAAANDALALAERALAAETTTRRSVLQAELQLSQAEREIERAREARVTAEQAFVQLTGLPADSAVELPAPPVIDGTVDDAIAHARSDRPDLLAADARIDASRRQIQAHWAGWTPDITGRFTQVYLEHATLSDDKTPWMVVVEGQWVLWDGGYRLAKAREYAEQAHMAELARDKAAITAEGEVRVAWEKYARAEAAAEATEREVALAEESLDLAKRAFEAEQIAWIEVEQAELGAHAARLARLVERMNRDVAAYELLVAAGRW